MKKRFFHLSKIVGLLSFVFLLNSCNDKPKEDPQIVNMTEVETDHILNNSVLTKEEQEKLSPADVLSILKKGNEEFVNDNLTVRNNSERVRDAALGQYPKAVILSCLDSRVPVEDVFHRGIGDIFVARVAGNVVNADILASLEYACKVSGSKLIVVLGHEYCGAIKSSIDEVKMGNITTLLSKIKPAIKKAKTEYKGEQSSKNPEFVEAVCDRNVHLSIDEIRSKSSILKEMEDRGEIQIVGGIYHMKTGRVNFFNE